MLAEYELPKRNSGLSNVLCSLTILFAFSFFLNKNLLAQDWQYSWVDTSGNSFSNPKINIDSVGRPHILYQQGSGQTLKHAVLSDYIWNIDSIDFTNFYADFVIDSEGNLHVVATNFITEIVQYALISGSNADIDTIFSPDGGVSGASITLDSENVPHIGLNVQDSLGLHVFYLYKVGNAWGRYSPVLVDAYNGDTDIEIGEDGEIYLVSANPNSPGYVTFCTDINGPWECETIYNGPVYGDVSLALENGNIPNIVFRYFRGSGMAGIVYMRKDGSNWTTEVLNDTLYNPLGDVPVAISSSSIVNIAFYSTTGYYSHLIHAYSYIGSEDWVYDAIEMEDFRGSVDLTLDADDIVHVSYKMDGNYLKYATRGIPTNITYEPHVPVNEFTIMDIYPNPTNSAVNIQIYSGSEYQDINYKIYDILGRLIQQKQIVRLHRGVNNIPIIINSDYDNTVSSAMYFIVVEGDDFKATKKLLFVK